MDSVDASYVLEHIASMAFTTEMLCLSAGTKSVPMQQDLLNKHFNRKHGPGAYYGQAKK
jgi:ribulose-5-phosphate 4-epimerase/fuculose-1-phosphate aldolase